MLFRHGQVRIACATGERRVRRSVKVAAVAAAAGTLLAACGSSSASSTSTTGATSSTSSTPATIILSNTLVAGDEIPLVYANATGLWKKYGLNVVVSTVSTAVQYTSLGAGQADVATGSPASIEAALQGAPEALVGYIGEDFVQLLAQSSVKNVAGLRGTTLGSSAPGSVTAGIEKLYLAQHGLTSADYNIAYFSGSFPATITALIAGQISATTAGYPFIATAEAGNPGLHPVATISGTPVGILTGNTMSVNTTWAAHNKGTLTKFVQAWNAATKLSNAHRAQSISLLAQAAKVTTPIATQWFDKQAPLDGWFALSHTQFQTIISSLASQYPNVSKASYSRIVNNSFVQAAG